MKKTFTPGPWTIFDCDKVIGVTRAAGDLADIAHLTESKGGLFSSKRTREETLATARLIAQAPALWGLAKQVARGENTHLLTGTALHLLIEIDGAHLGFTGQEQAKEMGATYTWRGPAANFQNLPKAPQLPPDVAAALGAAYQRFKLLESGPSVAQEMVRKVLGRYCNVAD